jgi:hypothetical protein
MMAKQSEFFASRTGKILTIDGASHRSPVRVAAAESIKVIASN